MNKLINKFAILTFGLLAILTFNSAVAAQICGTPLPKNGAEKVWTLTAINGETVNTDKATLSLDFENNRVGGKGGCNGFGGTLEKKGGKIKISQVFSTKMFCEDGSEVENKYLSTLEKVNKLKMIDGKLQLFSGKTKILEFVAQN